MKKRVRLTALLLAAAMTLTMMGSVMGVAADLENSETVTLKEQAVKPASFKDGEKLSRVDVTVTDITAGIGQNAVTGSATIAMHADSDFTGGVLQIANFYTSNTAPNYASYKIVVTNVVAKAPGAKLIVTIKDAAKNYSRDVVIPITGFDNGTPPVDPDPDPPTTTEGTARYSVTKVSSSRQVGGVDVPAEKPRFDITDITSGSNASIYKTYFANVTVKVTDKSLAAGITGVNVKTGDMGSFVFSTASGSTVTIGESIGGYCEIKFEALRYTGNGKKLSFQIVDNSGNMVTATADITECITRQEEQAENDKNDNDDDTGSKLEVETPYVIVNKYGYGGGDVTAGETFTLSMTFQNTSEDLDVTNMMITLTMPDDLMLTSSSNTFYVPELAKQKSITKAVQVTAKAAAKVQSHNIGASMKYQYIDDRLNTRKDATTTENIAIPVVQVDRFEVTAVEIPMDIMLEEETSVTVSFVNKGRSEVYNLAASIDGNIINPGQNQNLGNLASGATGTADFFIKPNEAGQVAGTITITYEDTNMEQKVATIPYNATVKTAEEMGGGNMGGMMPGMGGEIEMPVEPEKKSIWPVVAIAAVVVLIPVGLVVKKKLDQKRKEQEDADL